MIEKQKASAAYAKKKIPCDYHDIGFRMLMEQQALIFLVDSDMARAWHRKNLATVPTQYAKRIFQVNQELIREDETVEMFEGVIELDSGQAIVKLPKSFVTIHQN